MGTVLDHIDVVVRETLFQTMDHRQLHAVHFHIPLIRHPDVAVRVGRGIRRQTDLRRRRSRHQRALLVPAQLLVHLRGIDAAAAGIGLAGHHEDDGGVLRLFLLGCGKDRSDAGEQHESDAGEQHESDAVDWRGDAAWRIGNRGGH
jgi:hypothetical protein